MRRHYSLACGAVLVGALTLVVNASSYPSTWTQSLIGLSRSEVHQRLGPPDGNFMPKGWDGWQTRVLIGTWILQVTYEPDASSIGDPPPGSVPRASEVHQQFLLGTARHFVSINWSP